MTGSELDYVRMTIENEGFDYAYRSYTDFEDEVKDVEFHRLREAYIKAAQALDDYVGSNE